MFTHCREPLVRLRYDPATLAGRIADVSRPWEGELGPIVPSLPSFGRVAEALGGALPR
jgi:hypothetical protein